MKRGFTLIELLAVIIILSIIALIATPIVLDVIEDSRNEAALSTVSGIVAAGEYYYAESMFDNEKKIDIANLNDIYVDVILQGDKPENGHLYVNDNGQVAVSVVIRDKCYVKDFYSSINVYESDSELCSLGTVSEDNIAPVVSIDILGEENNGWHKTSTYATIAVSDDVSGILNYKWCLGINCNPINEEKNNKTINILDTTGTQVCVIAKDKALNESSKVCSDIIKVDTVAPEFTGIADVTILKDATFNLRENVTATDVTSGLETFTVNPTSVDTSKSGITNVTYTAIDKAGNEKVITRKITVSADAPVVTFTPTAGNINAQGWAKEDFYVDINIIDQSGHGIKEMHICTSLTDTCNPDSGSVVNEGVASRLISTESNNNRICVKAIDNTNVDSGVVCSDAYKLDKTAPTAGNISITGTLGSNGWYKSNVTIVPVNGTDSLSGHDTTTVNISSITENTNGTVVTVTTTDKAGNTSSADYTVKVDKTTPTVSIAKSSESSANKFVATVTPASNISGITYKWYRNNTLISGAESSEYTTNEAGTYKVVVETNAGNTATSNTITAEEIIGMYAATANYSCDNGTLAGTSCVLSTSKESYKYCNSGELTNGNCVSTSTTSTTTGYNYSCPSGYSASGTITASTTCYKTTTSTTSPNSSTSYSCPSGYTPTSGVTSTTTCSKSTTTTAASVGTTTYACPSGYSASGTITSSTTCSKTTTSTASSVAKYKCPSGYSASGTITSTTTCSKVEQTNPTGINCSSYGSGWYTCTNWSSSKPESHKHCIKDVAIQCPSGYISDSYTLCVKQGIQSCNGSAACLASYRKLESEGGTAKLKSDIACPSGSERFQGNEYQSDDYYVGTCYQSKSAKNSDMICASGTYNSSTGKCEKTSTKAAVLDKYECPSGYSASGTITASTTCSKSTTTTAASVGTTTYSCPSGYSATGTITSTTTCSKTTTTTTSPNSSTSYYCPSGYSPSGSVSSTTTCSKSTTTTSSPNSSPYQYCATGTLSNGVCVVTNQTTAQTGYRCPEGYTSTGDSQTASCVKQIDANVTYTCPNGGTLNKDMCIN